MTRVVFVAKNPNNTITQPPRSASNKKLIFKNLPNVPQKVSVDLAKLPVTPSSVPNNKKGDL